MQQELLKQVVITKPPTLVVQGNHKQVGLSQSFNKLSAAYFTLPGLGARNTHGIAQRSTEAIQDGCGKQVFPGVLRLV